MRGRFLLLSFVHYYFLEISEAAIVPHAGGTPPAFVSLIPRNAMREPSPVQFISTSLMRFRRKTQYGRIRSRYLSMQLSDLKQSKVKITKELEVTVFEASGWAWTGNENAYGLVMWPGARAVAKVLVEQKAPMLQAGLRVVELGAGSGLCSLACAALGANVLCTDLNADPLKLAQAAAELQGFAINTRCFDILGAEALPSCDILVSADCIYTPELGRGLARRVIEARQGGAIAAVVGSALNRPGYAAFREELRKAGVAAVRSEKVTDFTSPLWLLDIARGNYIQEVSIY